MAAAVCCLCADTSSDTIRYIYVVYAGGLNSMYGCAPADGERLRIWFSFVSLPRQQSGMAAHLRTTSTLTYVPCQPVACQGALPPG